MNSTQEQFGEYGGAMSNWTVYRIDGAGMWHFEDGDRAANWLSRLVAMGYRARMERVD